MLPIDEMIQLPGKDQLRKQVEWTDEDLTPLREDLLLYIDNELDAARKNKLEEQLSKDSILNSELKSLQQTKLATEVVEMPAKEELYRSEKDRKPIPIRWTRWVAAAAAILGIGWFSLSVITKQQSNTGELAVTPTKSQDNQTIVVPGETEQNKNEQIVEPVEQPQKAQYAAVDGKSRQATDKITNVIPASTIQKAKATPDKRDLLPNMSEQLAVVLPPTGVEDGSQADLHKIAAPKVDEDLLATNAAVRQGKPTDNTQPSPYKYASYDENIEEENQYVNIAGAQISKQKLRGVFRNVTRTVTRTFDKITESEANVSTI
jgi:hypothetical protein